MTKERLKAEVEQKFWAALEIRGVHTKLEGIDKHKVYHWRKGERPIGPTFGDMINVLWQLGQLEISLISELEKA